jgi:hypothetical protein
VVNIWGGFEIDGGELTLTEDTFLVMLSEDIKKRAFEIITFRGKRKLSKENCLIKYTSLIGYKIIRLYFRERIFLPVVCNPKIIYAILI